MFFTVPKITVMKELPPYTKGEEIVNVLTHFVAFIYMIYMSRRLITHANKEGVRHHITARWIYCICMTNMFANSVLYHAWTQPTIKLVWRYIDHVSVFIGLVSICCPFLMHRLTRYSYLAMTVLWSLCVFGSISKIVNFDKFEQISTAYYTVLGFMVSFAPLSEWLRMPRRVAYLFFSGCFIHLIGDFFYAQSEEIRYSHGVFHVIALIATHFHASAIDALID